MMARPWGRGSRPIGLAFAFACLGCGGTNDALSPVRGRITLDGQPLPRGSVSLRPVSAGSTHQPTGMIEPAGEFVIYTNGRAGALPGQYHVVVFATEGTTAADGAARPGLPKSLIPTRYNQPDQTPLLLEVVTPGVAKSYDLELTSHAR